jgi:hypothetical protein
VKCLQDVAGVTGSPASSYAHELMGAVIVPYSAAMAAFMNRDMPKWEGIVAHALPNTDKLSGDSFGMLNSLSYNRGASFSNAGSRFTEMRNIHAWMTSEQFDRIPNEFRSMKRLWPNVRGLRDRRDQEADIFQKGLVAA